MGNILGWDSWEVSDVQEDEHDRIVRARPLFDLDGCPICGHMPLNAYGHGVREERYMDVPAQGKRVGILVQRRRYKCKDCGKYFTQPLRQMDDKRFATMRLVKYVQAESLKEPFTKVADDVGLHEWTVRDIFKEYVKKLEERAKFKTPEWMGIDECHLANKARGMIADVKQRTIVNVLKDRNKATVTGYLSGISSIERKKIELVTIDMWRPYKEAVEEVLPKVPLVIDKFHVTRMAEQSLEKVRKSIRLSLSDKDRRQLMRDRFLLLHRRRDLSDEQIAIRDPWLETFPLLAAAYELKEDFHDIFEFTDKQDGLALWEEWQTKVTDQLEPYFHDLLTAMNNWHEQIFNYFDYRVTNAYTEALNGLVKTAYRVGRGYSFEAIRAKMLFCGGLHRQYKPKFGEGQKLRDYVTRRREVQVEAIRPNVEGHDLLSLNPLRTRIAPASQRRDPGRSAHWLRNYSMPWTDLEGPSISTITAMLEEGTFWPDSTITDFDLEL